MPSKIGPTASWFVGFTTGAIVTFAGLFLAFFPKLQDIYDIQQKTIQVQQSTQSQLSQQLHEAYVSSVMIAEPAQPSEQAGQFLGSLLAAFFGRPESAHQIASEMNSSGLSPRFFINTATHQIASYNDEGSQAVYYYFEPNRKVWVGPVSVPPVQTLTANPVK